MNGFFKAPLSKLKTGQHFQAGSGQPIKAIHKFFTSQAGDTNNSALKKRNHLKYSQLRIHVSDSRGATRDTGLPPSLLRCRKK